MLFGIFEEEVFEERFSEMVFEAVIMQFVQFGVDVTAL